VRAARQGPPQRRRLQGGGADWAAEQGWAPPRLQRCAGALLACQLGGMGVPLCAGEGNSFRKRTVGH
jgi:hypothetical protein